MDKISDEVMLEVNRKDLSMWEVTGNKYSKPHIQGYYLDEKGGRHLLSQDIKSLAYNTNVKIVDCIDGQKFKLD